jgi:hypothetical protein
VTALHWVLFHLSLEFVAVRITPEGEQVRKARIEQEGVVRPVEREREVRRQVPRPLSSAGRTGPTRGHCFQRFLPIGRDVCWEVERCGGEQV